VTVDRGELLAYYADASKDVVQRIKDAAPVKAEDADHDTYRDGTISDMIVVCKGWHLPSGRVDLDDPRAWGKGEKDGRRVPPNHDGRHICTLEDGFVLTETGAMQHRVRQRIFDPRHRLKVDVSLAIWADVKLPTYPRQRHDPPVGR